MTYNYRGNAGIYTGIPHTSSGQMAQIRCIRQMSPCRKGNFIAIRSGKGRKEHKV